MTGYPHRYGTGPAATRHYAIACAASAAVLRREGHPHQARDLEAAARDAQRGASEPPADPSMEAAQGEGPSWWR